jgi:hypothetical protein
MGMKKIKDIKLYHSAEKYCQQQLATNYRIQTLDPNTIGLSDAYRCGTKDHNEPLLCKQESKIAFLSKVLYVSVFFLVCSTTKDCRRFFVHQANSFLSDWKTIGQNAWRMPWKWSGDPQQLGEKNRLIVMT